MAFNFRRNPSEDTLCDEAAPLLAHDYDGLVLQKQAYPRQTPLPKAQLAALCFVRLADPVAFTQIFPYINEFITSFDLTPDPSRIAFYSGLVESSFALAQLCSIYHWAKMSDIIGRRPVILAGTLGLAITTTLLGFSSTLQHIILSRIFAGLCSGTVAVIHSVLGELTDSTNQHVAFPIYGLFWPLGSIIGPLIGGSLSNAAARYPAYFDYNLFQRFPYILPCIVAAIVALGGAVLGFYCLEETLPSKKQQYLSKDPGAVGYGTPQRVERPALPPPSMRELLSIPIVRALSISGFVLSFISTAFDVVFVLFCYTSINVGGLSFSASEIGYSLATAGALSATIQLLIMPTVLRIFNTVKLYNCCMAIWPATFLSLPFLNLIARAGLDPVTGRLDPHTNAVLWIGIALVLGCSRIACLAFSISMILVKENAPSPSALGSSNGLVQFAMCSSRAISPAFVSSAFALSVKYNIMGGYMWVLVMVAISVFGCSITQGIPRIQKA